MKKTILLFVLLFSLITQAQTTANRFLYELSFKPKKDSTRIDKVLTVLDVLPQKSIYEDFTMRAQDSTIKIQVEEMVKTKTWKDLSKSIRIPKFTYKIVKTYPSMEETYVDRISRNLFGYTQNNVFTWNILPDKQKIGDYNTQKAETDFGGRHWIAWFSTDIPLQDGPYKFYGLPGLIVKIEDTGKNYSWELKGNKKIDNYDEVSELEKIQAKYQGMSNTVNVTSQEKFDKAYAAYKADPLAEFRPYMTPEMMSRKMPGSDKTIGEIVRDQEKMAKDFFAANNNPIEIPQNMAPKKK